MGWAWWWGTSAGPVHRPPLRVPGPHQSEPDQDHLLGRHRVLPVHKAARAWCLPVAAERQTGRDAVVDLRTAIAADRRRRLARAGATLASGNSGLTLRLIDSMTPAERRERCESATVRRHGHQSRRPAG